jgi:hypothetical protein
LLVVAETGTGKTLALAAHAAWLVQQAFAVDDVFSPCRGRDGTPRRPAWALGCSAKRPPRIDLAPGFTVLDRSGAQDLLGISRRALGLAPSEHRCPPPPTCLATERLPKTLWSERRGAAKPQLRAVQDEAAQTHGVADVVLAQREEGLLLKRQAVLFRTGTHSAAFELELTRRGISFIKYGGLRFLESAHIKDVLAVLRTARLVPGPGPASLKRLLEHGGTLHDFKPPASAAEAWGALCNLMRHLRSDAAVGPVDLQSVIGWYQPYLGPLYGDTRMPRAKHAGRCGHRQPHRD